ncbi:uncharacterized protein LOC127840110 [Dreissena polymorpha]|uniref:EF-hand domain-containing protein n=1 Tax=Dreissena polymorpha TaxID=45954 RepID=A0A9D4IYD2_DREPO|nr:uncharacterized protein LOC127840110 [Dreissena polymorpha]KAH3791480.1 hypothetical protein DPMN_144966 [Dreissena polymorpha]
MNITSIIIALSFISACRGLNMTRLRPYDLTAELMFIFEDIDQNGIMTVFEFETVFDRYDSNVDGRLTRSEYTTYICKSDPVQYELSHYLFDEYDVDGDHFLDYHDYDNFYNKMDTSADGLVVKTEFVNYWVLLFQKYENSDIHPMSTRCR